MNIRRCKLVIPEFVLWPSGLGVHLRICRQYLLEILGNVTDNRLRFTWVYSNLIHNRAVIERLAQRFIAALREITAHCLSPEAGGHTPSDFPLAHLDAKNLSKLSKLIDEED